VAFAEYRICPGTDGDGQEYWSVAAVVPFSVIVIV
jgi:hypothetical protein